MYTETRGSDMAFQGLKQSDTYRIEITADDLRFAQRESPLIKKFTEANARKDAIKQIDVALQLIHGTESNEARRLKQIKEVYEKIDDGDFIKYIYNETNLTKIEMYIASIYNESHGAISARQYALMYLAGINGIYDHIDRDHTDRLDRAIELISGLSDRAYINLTMDLMDATGREMSALRRLINEHGSDMIKDAKEKEVISNGDKSD